MLAVSGMRREVLELIQETPAIDVHSHQGTNGVWQARNLWELFSYHWLAADIRCAGCPAEVFTDKNLDARERMQRAAPYSGLARNTVNHWCFMNIARDLYGFQDEALDEGNWQWLWDAVQEKAQDPSWEPHVMDRAGVELASAAHDQPPRHPDRYFAYEYGEYLFCPGLKGDPKQCLADIGTGIDSASSLAQAVARKIRGLVRNEGIRALHVWAPVEWLYAPVAEKQANALLNRAMASAHLDLHERHQLGSFVADITAKVCGEHDVVVQLFLGAAQMQEGGPWVSLYRPEWLRAMVSLFAKYPRTRFDVFLATQPISHEATVVARNYPNVSVSGAWWQGFTPSTISTFFRDRLEMLPMNKWNAFYSDAYCVEWIYGKCSLTRNRLAVALSEMVDEGLIGRDMVGQMARSVLCDNARSMYLLEGD